MGVLFDLIIANEGDAEKIGMTPNIFEHYWVIPTKLLDPLTVDELFRTIDSASPNIETWWETPLFEADNSLWVYQLPDYFVRRMASMNEGEKKVIAKAWLDVDDIMFQFRGTKATYTKLLEFMVELFGEMCETAQHAIKWNMKLFLCVCL